MSGIDRLFSGLRTSSSALLAEREHINVIAENIANAHTTRTADGTPYRRKMVIFEPLLQKKLPGRPEPLCEGVGPTRTVEDHATPMEMVLDMSHPHRNAEGFVEYPNVNTVTEMADLITAMRAYEANLTAQESFLRMAEKALQLAR